jgi:hypothetical protein
MALFSVPGLGPAVLKQRSLNVRCRNLSAVGRCMTSPSEYLCHDGLGAWRVSLLLVACFWSMRSNDWGLTGGIS